jgi:hypothetical protein
LSASTKNTASTFIEQFNPAIHELQQLFRLIFRGCDTYCSLSWHRVIDLSYREVHCLQSSTLTEKYETKTVICQERLSRTCRRNCRWCMLWKTPQIQHFICWSCKGKKTKPKPCMQQERLNQNLWEIVQAIRKVDKEEP